MRIKSNENMKEEIRTWDALQDNLGFKRFNSRDRKSEVEESAKEQQGETSWVEGPTLEIGKMAAATAERFKLFENEIEDKGCQTTDDTEGQRG